MSEGARQLIVALAELAGQVRQRTLELLGAAEPSWLTWSPPGTSNHILWHAGHALWLPPGEPVDVVPSHLPPGDEVAAHQGPEQHAAADQRRHGERW